MEIPVVKLKLYRQNPKRFGKDLSQALKTVGVAQVDGVDYGLVQELYAKADYIQKKTGTYTGNSYYRENFNFSVGYFGLTTNHIFFPPEIPMNLVDRIKEQFSKVAEKIADSMSLRYYEPSNLVLSRYFKGPRLYPFSPKNKSRKIILNDHKDSGSFTLHAPSSHQGLEGFIQKQWISLLAERGNVLVIPGKSLEQESKRKIKALLHQVKAPEPFGSTRYTLIYA